MNVLDLFRHRGSAAAARSAPVARERLQILLSHERTTRGHRDLLAVLREEILSAIARHVSVGQDNVQVQMERGGTVSTLEINVEIPHAVAGVPAGAPRGW